MQTFPPYSLGFKANIPALLAEVAKQVKPVEDDRPWINPLDTFNEASEAICLRGFQVDQELELGRLINRYVARVGAVQDLVHVIGYPPPELAVIARIGHQPTPLHVITEGYMRQIEAVELMSAMNNFTARYAHALLGRPGARISSNRRRSMV